MGNRFKYFLLMIIFSLAFETTVTAQKSWKLDVTGNVRDEDSKEAVKGAKIEILKGGVPYKTLTVDESGNFSYTLDPDNLYTIKVSYGNYVSKTITISTENTPSDEEVKENFKATTEFRIFKRIPEIDYSVLDSPIGSIFFNADDSKFDYSVVDFDLKAKLDALKKEIEKKKAEQLALQKAEKDAALKRATSVKDSLAKADAEMKKKALLEADEAKKKSLAEAKASEEAKKKAQLEEEAAKKKSQLEADEAKKKSLTDAKAAEEAKKKAQLEEEAA